MKLPIIGGIGRAGTADNFDSGRTKQLSLTQKYIENNLFTVKVVNKVTAIITVNE